MKKTQVKNVVELILQILIEYLSNKNVLKYFFRSSFSFSFNRPSQRDEVNR